MKQPIRVVALMTVRNEERYLDRCLRHFIDQGIDVCVIDNDSTDRTLEIAQQYLGKGVIRIENISHKGVFELAKILENEERLAGEIEADWFMHHDADEIRQPPAPYQRMIDAITDIDRQGYNAINFDEFVFVPTREDRDEIPIDYVSGMKYYYFYEPVLRRQVTLWKKGDYQVDLASNAGHRVRFQGRRVYPENFIMRHYIALSNSHMRTKYDERKFSQKELGRGWHQTRIAHPEDAYYMPSRRELVELSQDGIWDRSNPFRRHLVFHEKMLWKKRIRNFLVRLFQRLMIKLGL